MKNCLQESVDACFFFLFRVDSISRLGRSGDSVAGSCDV